MKPAKLIRDALLVDLDCVVYLLDNACPFSKGNSGSEICRIAYRETDRGAKREVRCPDRTVDRNNFVAPPDCPLRLNNEVSVRPLESFKAGDRVHWGNNREGVVIQRNPRRGTVLVHYQPGEGRRDTKVMLNEREIRRIKVQQKGDSNVAVDA